MSGELRDKFGREIVMGDVVKVFHFVGARRKRYYMFKQAMGEARMGKGAGSPYMMFSHLDMTAERYHEAMDGRCLPHYEIIQSLDCKFEQRSREVPK